MYLKLSTSDNFSCVDFREQTLSKGPSHFLSATALGNGQKNGGIGKTTVRGVIYNVEKTYLGLKMSGSIRGRR